MIQYTIQDMTCGHCVQRITRAVQAVDAAATVHADVASKQVRIDSQAAETAVRQAIVEAGYSPTAAT